MASEEGSINRTPAGARSSVGTRHASPSALPTFNIGLRAIAIGALIYLLIHLLATTQLYATALVVAGITALMVIDLGRVISRLHRSTERFLENLSTGVVETPIHRFAGQARALAAFEHAASKLQATRSEQRQALDYLQTLLDTVTAALVIVCADGRIKLANRAARKLAVQALDRLETIAAVGAPAAQAILALPPGARQIVAMANGQPMLVAVAQIAVTGQAPERLISLQRISGELDAVELKAWQDMARVLAHEMMNSLTPIASLSESLELLLRNATQREALPLNAGSDEIAGALEAIKRRSHGLMNFVERYRKLAELPQPRMQRIEVNEFLASIERLMSSTFKHQGVEYRSRVRPQSVSCFADPELLEQAVINLLRNAVDAVAETAQPVVEISCCLQESQLLITVADNGRGLPDPDQVFVPFFTTKPGGSGIGLNLARQIALAHGGKLEARPHQPCGTVFELALPVGAEAEMNRPSL